MLTLRPANREFWREPLTVDRLFREPLTRFFDEFEDSRTWSPVVDIYEEKGNIVLKAELPGFNQKDIQISVENGRLSVSGERKFEKNVEEQDYHRRERLYGKFVRSFQLPNTSNLDKIEATLKDGVLTLVIPKKEEARPRQIEVKG